MPVGDVPLRKMRVSNARAELQLTQAQLAQLAHVARSVVFSAEKGQVISRLSAYAILNALNAVRAGKGLPELELADLDWKIQGD